MFLAYSDVNQTMRRKADESINLPENKKILLSKMSLKYATEYATFVTMYATRRCFETRLALFVKLTKISVKRRFKLQNIIP